MIEKKRALRRRMLDRLRRQPEPQRLAKSLKIARRLRRLALYRQARSILCYAAFDGEVETRPILREALEDGKRVAVPVCQPHTRRMIPRQIGDPDRDLRAAGSYGIPEPAGSRHRRIDPRRLGLIVVPGVAFDRRGRRLGRGGGYFDRFLARLPASIPRVGLAFRFQVVRKIPWEGHDQPVCKVITE